MIKLTPTARLEWVLAQQCFHAAHSTVRDVLACYESFLADTDAAEEELVSRFLDKNKSQEYFRTANKLGDLVFDVLDRIG